MNINKIITIGGQDYLLPASLTDAEALKLTMGLGGLTKVEREYYPNETSQYGVYVIVTSGVVADVTLRMTADEVISEEVYREKKKAGQAAYAAKNQAA